MSVPVRRSLNPIDPSDLASQPKNRIPIPPSLSPIQERMESILNSSQKVYVQGQTDRNYQAYINYLDNFIGNYSNLDPDIVLRITDVYLASRATEQNPESRSTQDLCSIQ